MKALHKPFRVKVGINPISWMNDDLPSLGGEIPLETALSEGKEIGYAGFELGNKFPKTPEALRRVLQQYNLECVSGWYSGYLAIRSVQEEIADLKPHLELLAENGSKVLVYGEVAHAVQGLPSVPLYKRPRFSTHEAWQAYSEKLTALAQYTLSQGIHLSYHHHMGAYVESVEDVDQLMTMTGEEVGLLFDSGHLSFASGCVDTAYQVLVRHIKRVTHVHCKDVRPEVMKLARNGSWSFLQSVLNGVFTVPGDGGINFERLLRVLYQHDYQGWLVVEAEQDPAVAPSYQYAKKGYDHLQHLISELTQYSSHTGKAYVTTG